MWLQIIIKTATTIKEIKAATTMAMVVRSSRMAAMLAPEERLWLRLRLHFRPSFIYNHQYHRAFQQWTPITI